MKNLEMKSEESYRQAYVISLLAKGVPACLCAHLVGRRQLVSMIKNETGLRREYGGLATKPLGVAMSGSLLASSVIKPSKVMIPTGHEVGIEVNMSDEEFNHDWETGTGEAL